MKNKIYNIQNLKSKNKQLISVIITTKNEEENIRNCLESIFLQTYKNIEIIVVDNNSIDQTKELVNASKIQHPKSNIYFYTKGPERSAQRNFGAKKAKGEYLFFLDADMILARKVVEECMSAVKNSSGYKTQAIKLHKEKSPKIQNPKSKTRTVGGIIIPEKSFGKGFWAKCKALERSFYVGVDWIEAARFYKKDIFEQLKGYDEKQTGTEDFDLSQRLKEKFGKRSIARINTCILHDEGRLSLIDTLKKKYYYAQTLHEYNKIEANQKLFQKQSSLFSRYFLYFSNPKKMFEQPFIGFGMLFMKTAEFCAGAAGMLVGKENKK